MPKGNEDATSIRAAKSGSTSSEEDAMPKGNEDNSPSGSGLMPQYRPSEEDAMPKGNEDLAIRRGIACPIEDLSEEDAMPKGNEDFDIAATPEREGIVRRGRDAERQ